MYRAGPPDPVLDGGTLCLSQAERRRFEGSSAAATDPMLRGYLTDIVRPYGLALRADLLDQGSGHSYGEMAGTLLADTVLAHEPVDLIVFAFAVPDVVPGRSTAAHLSHLCPGRPLAFAVCDQGTAAPFTGLRMIREYTRAGNCRQALLVIAEQATLHYEMAAPAALPTSHVAVMLRFGESGHGRLKAVGQHAGVTAEQAGDLLGGELAVLSAGRSDVTLVAGSGLADLATGGAAGAFQPAALADAVAAVQVVVAPAGQPSTGVWWELAGRLPGWATHGMLVVLADYEPMLGYLCVAAIDMLARPTAVRRPGTA